MSISDISTKTTTIFAVSVVSQASPKIIVRQFSLPRLTNCYRNNLFIKKVWRAVVGYPDRYKVTARALTYAGRPGKYPCDRIDNRSGRSVNQAER